MEQKISNILENLTLFHAITLFFVIALLVYGNTLFNEFVADDITYIINNPIAHTVNLGNSFGMNDFNNEGQYRPLQPTYFSLLYSLFGTTPFPYHLLQIMLHAVATTLLYVLFRKFLSSGIALLVALVFLIHPMQVESVSYIAQTASPMFFFLGIIPLLLSMRKTLSIKMLVLISLLLLFSLFAKETGILFLFLILTYSYLFARNNLSHLSISAVIVLAIYAYCRLGIAQVDLSTRLLAPIASLSLVERLFNIPITIIYYLKTFFFPKTLAYLQTWVITSLDVSTFYIPLFITIALFSFISISGLYIFRQKKQDFKPFLFFSVWFFLGLSFHLNIFPLDMTVADRWFYFTMAGLLGLTGLIYQNFAKKMPFYTIVSFLLSLLILFSLATRTVTRNADWQNELKLYKHDIIYNDNYLLNELLGVDYGYLGQNDKALKHLQKAVSLRPYEHNILNIAILYQSGEF